MSHSCRVHACELLVVGFDGDGLSQTMPQSVSLCAESEIESFRTCKSYSCRIPACELWVVGFEGDEFSQVTILEFLCAIRFLSVFVQFECVFVRRIRIPERVPACEVWFVDLRWG